MTWLTFLIGIVLFAIGAAARWLIALPSWQALLPIVYGLVFLTLAEGMRSSLQRRRVFFFVALCWALVVLVASSRYVVHFMQAWNQQPIVFDDAPVRSELVLEQTGVFAATLVWLLIALLYFFRKPSTLPTGSSTPESPSPAR